MWFHGTPPPGSVSAMPLAAGRWIDEIPGTASQAAPALALARIPRCCPQGHPRWLWTCPVVRPEGKGGDGRHRWAVHGARGDWSIRRQCVAARAVAGSGRHVQGLSTGYSTAAVDLWSGCAERLVNSQAPCCSPRQCWICDACAALVHRVIHAGCGLCAPTARRLIRPRCMPDHEGLYGAGVDEIPGTALQGAPVLALAHMPRACPQGIPRWLWTLGAQVQATLSPGPGALVKSQALRRSPRRHWLCAVSIRLVHRVIHRGCGL